VLVGRRRHIDRSEDDDGPGDDNKPFILIQR
jgi:hypothetical protein